MKAATAHNEQPVAQHLNLLSCNILAGGSMARYRDYVTQSWKHVLPARSKRGNLDRFAGLLADFDVVGLQEADAGSLRSGFVNQTQYLAEAAHFPYWSHQPNRNVARFAASANGLLTRIAPDEVRDYPLPGRIPGRGALWARPARSLSRYPRATRRSCRRASNAPIRSSRRSPRVRASARSRSTCRAVRRSSRCRLRCRRRCRSRASSAAPGTRSGCGSNDARRAGPLESILLTRSNGPGPIIGAPCRHCPTA